MLDQFCCTIVKRGNILLRMGEVVCGGALVDQDDAQGETGWSVD